MVINEIIVQSKFELAFNNNKDEVDGTEETPWSFA